MKNNKTLNLEKIYLIYSILNKLVKSCFIFFRLWKNKIKHLTFIFLEGGQRDSTGYSSTSKLQSVTSWSEAGCLQQNDNLPCLTNKFFTEYIIIIIISTNV